MPSTGRGSGARGVLAVAVAAALAAAAAGCGADAEGPSAASGSATSTTVVESPKAQASIVCDGRETRALTARVRAQGDGVHVRVENTSQARLPWSALASGGNSEAGMGGDAPVGVSEHVLPFPPGTLHVGCDGADGAPSGRPHAAIEVVDPDGVWTDASLAACDRFSVIADYTADAKGSSGSPVDVIRGYLGKHDRLRSGDVVERAGYREADEPARVRLVRDDRVVALFALMGDGDGGWLLSQTDACSGIGFD